MDFMNKKGIMFTLVSLVMAAFFILLFSNPVELPLDSSVPTLSFRVTLIDRYKQSWEDYLGNSLRVASYRALQGMSDHVDDPSNALFSNPSEFERIFHECLVNGTITRPGFSGSCPGMQSPENVTLPFWLKSITNVSFSQLRINTTYEINEVSIFQVFPFHVFVNMNVSYRIQDTFASINKNITITELISIEGIREPYGANYLNTVQTRVIKATTIQNSEWDVDKLAAFVENEEYRYSDSAPSFLQRFVDDLSGSTCCGIEAVLSEDPAVDNIANLENGSYIDHIYLYDYYDAGKSRFPCEEAFTITAGANATLNDNVFLDQGTLVSFNVSTTDWLTSCIS